MSGRSSVQGSEHRKKKKKVVVKKRKVPKEQLPPPSQEPMTVTKELKEPIEHIPCANAPKESLPEEKLVKELEQTRLSEEPMSIIKEEPLIIHKPT
jgi:hypothetical protein